MTKRVALYLRESEDGQTIEGQRQKLQTVARLRGWNVVAEFTDKRINGAKGRDARPAFHRMLKAVTRGEVDMVAAWAVDSLGRSLQDLISFLCEIQMAGIDLFLHKQSLDTSVRAGRAVFQTLGIFAEFERSKTIARIHSGLKRARNEKKRAGRPRIAQPLEAKIRAAVERGDLGILKIAKKYKVGSGTVQRIRASIVAQPFAIVEGLSSAV